MKRQLEGEITKDARKQVREGRLHGPIKGTRCTLTNPGPGGRLTYECLAITSEGRDRTEGYAYHGTANARNSETTWKLLR